ncbi:penicillin-binding protein [Sporosarcina sp. NCCP-2222]|uniref:serine hydrolase domain-containing protein n=1 Tax=Sporosarcina sp. NCCP-2222 TaxID=2935073 RepID=UPI002081072A|nr:serine hydrolase domain-containing protein [Sporosarcina sp. NCCP-2222]GKV57617.1 penicillin-binding protein [Sporosarcina sp. NCCP-2222]
MKKLVGDISIDTLTTYIEKTRQEKCASGVALVLMQDDKIVYEHYSGTHHSESGARQIDMNSQFNVYSTRVTYIGLAIAIAVVEGVLNLDDYIKKYLPEFSEEILGDTTIRHVVTRCTGLKFRGQEVSRVFELGTHLEGKRPDLLALIHKRATGKTIAEVLTDKVLEPLAMTQTGWMTEGKNTLVCDIKSPASFPTLRLGSNDGADRNLYVSARELALWGNLHLNKGIVGGRRILPEEVFNLTSKVQSPDTLPDTLSKFGFLWWVKDNRTSYEYDELGSELPEGSFQILGASGCSCTVIPKFNAVAVRMYNSLYTTDSDEFDYIGDIRRFGNMVAACLK